MRNLCIATLALVVASSSAMADWGVTALPKMSGLDAERYVLIYHADAERGTRSIGEAVGDLAKAGHIVALRTLTLHDLVQDETFQKELFEQLEKIAKEGLDAARRSAGNMHNPKMTALHADFARAVMGTPTVTAFAAALAPHGMKISGPSFEKLELHKENQGHRLWCFLWLSVEPGAEPEKREYSHEAALTGEPLVSDRPVIAGMSLREFHAATKFPRFKFSGTLSDAITRLMVDSKKYAPEARTVGGFALKNGVNAEAKVKIDATGCNALELINQLCAATDTTWTFGPYSIVIAPRGKDKDK